MKSFINLIQKGKSICRHIVSSMFDSNNPETAVEHFLRSTEIDSGIIEKRDEHSEIYPSLYSEPSNDFYMESEKVVNKRNEEGSNSKQMNEDAILPQEEPETNTNGETQLICELAYLLEDLNRLNSQTDDENARSTIKYCKNRIVEILFSSGCMKIEGDTSFDCKYHVPFPFAIVPNGSIIEKTLQFGIKYHETVLKKAVVRIQKMDNE